MFLFSKKHRTLSSTCTNYCLLCSVKETIQDWAAQELWKYNKFVTQINPAGGGNFGVSTPTQLQMQQGGTRTCAQGASLNLCSVTVSCSLTRKVFDTPWHVLADFWSCILQWLWSLRAGSHQQKHEGRCCHMEWVSLPTPYCLWELTMPPLKNPSSQGQPKQVTEVAMQEHYRNTTINPATYQPEANWLSISKSSAKVPAVLLCHREHISMGLGV
ncbi:uncharacterized protein LOC117245611 [Parus major]|uniref:uncharacterized protein LOC117245611 n=1 Tax=Parus major TaxID=9157 RepID=UPI0014443CF5|nr:uncharacterized protein LOC117245611 [Parus major]